MTLVYENEGVEKNIVFSNIDKQVYNADIIERISVNIKVEDKIMEK